MAFASIRNTSLFNFGLKIFDIFRLDRIGGMIRESAVKLEVHGDDLAGQAFEYSGQDLTGHAITGIYYNLERLDRFWVQK